MISLPFLKSVDVFDAVIFKCCCCVGVSVVSGICMHMHNRRRSRRPKKEGQTNNSHSIGNVSYTQPSRPGPVESEANQWQHDLEHYTVHNPTYIVDDTLTRHSFDYRRSMSRYATPAHVRRRHGFDMGPTWVT